MEKKLLILKGVLLLRRCGNKYQSKEEQIAQQVKWNLSCDELRTWIKALQEELAKTPEQKERESQELIERMIEAETYSQRADEELLHGMENDFYSPSCPWNAPGMSVRDFI